MKKILTLLLFVAVLVVAASYLTDIPALSRVREVIDGVIGITHNRAEEFNDCYACEVACLDAFNKCKKENDCQSIDDRVEAQECVDKCADRYRACYYRCSGVFGEDQCPPMSVK